MTPLDLFVVFANFALILTPASAGVMIGVCYCNVGVCYTVHGKHKICRDDDDFFPRGWGEGYSVKVVKPPVTMTRMFSGVSSFTYTDLSKWDVSHSKDMREMFYDSASFNADISRWDVSRVKDMESMFNKAASFNADISNWDVSRVVTMRKMFADATSFKRNLSGIAWIRSTANKDDMFKGSAGSIPIERLAKVLRDPYHR